MPSRDALTETREEPGWKTGAALRVRRAHYLILGGAVLVLAGWLLVIRVLVPAILQSGVVETLGEVAALQRRLIESGNVEKADVQIGQTTSTKGAGRHLKVNAVWRGEPDSAESAATRLADVVLQTYAGIDTIGVALILALVGARASCAQHRAVPLLVALVLRFEIGRSVCLFNRSVYVPYPA